MPYNNSADASLSVVETIKILPLMSISLSVSSLSANHYCPPPLYARSGLHQYPLPPVFKLLGEVTVKINNCSPVELDILQHTKIGFLESACPSTVKEINPDLFINKIEQIETKDFTSFR